MEKILSINELRVIVNDERNNDLFPSKMSERAINCQVFFKQELTSQVETWIKSLAVYGWEYDEFLDAVMDELAKEKS